MVKTIFTTAIVFLMIGFIGCKSKTTTTEADTKFVISDSLYKTLKIQDAEKCPVVNALTLTGQVTFDEDKVAHIYPMLSGNITNVTAQLGDYVKQGQPLGVIRSSEMAGYTNDLVTSKTNMLIAKKNLDAAQDMYKSGLISEKDLITNEQLYKQSQAQLTRSNQVLSINGGNTNGEFIIKSPISGFVVEKQINNNQAIRNDNNSSLFTVSDLKDVWILANVYESSIGQVHLGDSVQVTTLSYPGRIFYGKVDKILNVLDPTNKVMKIRIVLPNNDYALKPQMFASVIVTTKSNNEAMCVPASSLVFDQSQYFILVYKSPSDVKAVPVERTGSDADRAYITGDVNVGDKIIASNAVLIYNALND